MDNLKEILFMYTVQYLFRKSNNSPNRSYSMVYLLLTLVFSIISFTNFCVKYSFLHGLISGLLTIGLSLPYFWGTRFWGLNNHIHTYLSKEGLSITSLYSLESAATSNNIFVDSITEDTDFNKKVIYISPLSMDRIEAKCEANLVGEFFCNITQEQSTNYILRRLAMGKVVTVALDNYSVIKALDEADCVLVPEGSDSQGSPACVYYNMDIYSTAAEACRIFLYCAQNLTKSMDSFYCRLALRCILFQLVLGIISFTHISIMGFAYVTAFFLLIIIVFSFIMSKIAVQEV